MAQGDIIMFDYTPRAVMLHEVYFDGSVDIIARLITNDLAATEEDDPPVLDDYTSAGAEDIVIPGGALYFDPATDISTFKASSVKWEGGVGQPENVYQILVYFDKAPFRPIVFIDVTPDDGGTPWDLTQASLEMVWAAAGVILKAEVV